MSRYYICEQGYQENEVAYYGPFDKSEMQERLNDAYADMLAYEADVYAVTLTAKEAVKIYINPREFWMEQLALLSS